MAFLASLSLYVASPQISANDAISLPPAPGLGIDFRCEPGDGGPINCPLIEDIVEFGIDDKYLAFQALDDSGSCDSPYTPLLTDGLDGVGVRCEDFSDAPNINRDQTVAISVEGGEGGTVTPMDGIYLAGLRNNDNDGCYTQSGTVYIEFEGGEGSSVIDWNSDINEGCETPDSHAIFVDFDGLPDVSYLEVRVNSAQSGNGAYAAGIETQGPNVNPDCFELGDGVCTIDLVEDPLPGQDMGVSTDDESLLGNVAVVDGFPVRVVDPRSSCEEDPTGSPEPLTFNETNIFTYYRPGDLVAQIGTLPLVVSDSGGTVEFLTLSAKGCGTPREAFDGDAVPREADDWQPYVDIIAIESDIDPVDSVITFVSENEAAYPCEPGPTPAPLPVGDALDQPLGEINSRADEVKQLAGVPGVVDPVSRDKTQTCGSRRAGSARYSFLGYTLIHNLQTDMRAELAQEIQVLKDTVTRTAACVDPRFFYGQLVAYPSYIERFFGIGANRAQSCNATIAGLYFDRTAILVDRYTARLQMLGSSGFERCYASGPNLDMIKASPPNALDSGDKPLNAYGDIISQLNHLSYALTTFRNELTKLPDSCP